jgi:hypothetical protein
MYYCYPQELSADAVFGADPPGMPVELVPGISIDDLIITGNVTFVSDDPGGTPRTLRTDSVTIQGQSGAPTIVTSQNRAWIFTEDRTP